MDRFESSSVFEAIEAETQVTVDHNKRELILKHLSLLLEINKIINLTRIESLDSALVLHVKDSLMALRELLDAPAGKLCDIGTGGGYPGIPLAVVTGRQTLLVDSVRKKIKAVQDIVNEMGLQQQIQTHVNRIEELALDAREMFAVVTARALSSLPSLVELASPLLQVGGWLISYKGRVDEQEIAQGDRAAEIVGMRRISERSFSLTENGVERAIIVYERYKDSQIALPRRIGLAQKRPLGK